MLPMLRHELRLMVIVTGSDGIFLKMALGDRFPGGLVSPDGSMNILRGLRESRLTK